MLPTFVIGLREGLEAALIVGIIAAFLRKQGRPDLVRLVFLGVGIAIALCTAAGLALNAFSRALPQRQQEGLETIIGLLAVGMVTYMVVWMKRNSRGLKKQLEGLADAALHGPGRAGWAMIGMAFLAVLREGIETVVFLIAAFNESTARGSAGIGLVLGLVVATALGYGIYRGGVKLNLSKFFRATGIVLVLVAAGLVVNAVHTAHEAGWLNVGQGATVDLSAVVRPGSVQASLLTGMLGLQPRPVVAEVLGWTIYVLIVGTFVVWPPGKAVRRRTLFRVIGGVAAATALVGVVLLLVRPGAPATRPTTTDGAVTAQLVASNGDQATVRTTGRDPFAATTAGPTDVVLTRSGTETVDGVAAAIYAASAPHADPTGLAPTMTAAAVSAANGSRLPLGFNTTSVSAFPANYTTTMTVTAWVDETTGTVLDVRWAATVRASVTSPTGLVAALAGPVRTGAVAFSADARSAAAADARSAAADTDHRDLLGSWATLFLGIAVAAIVALGVLGGRTWRERQRDEEPTRQPDPAPVS